MPGLFDCCCSSTAANDTDTDDDEQSLIAQNGYDDPRHILNTSRYGSSGVLSPNDANSINSGFGGGRYNEGGGIGLDGDFYGNGDLMLPSNINNNNNNGRLPNGDPNGANNERAILNRILVETQNRIIDVGAMDALGPGPEYNLRAAKYDLVLKGKSAHHHHSLNNNNNKLNGNGNGGSKGGMGGHRSMSSSGSSGGGKPSSRNHQQKFINNNNHHHHQRNNNGYHQSHAAIRQAAALSLQSNIPHSSKRNCLADKGSLIGETLGRPAGLSRAQMDYARKLGADITSAIQTGVTVDHKEDLVVHL